MASVKPSTRRKLVKYRAKRDFGITAEPSGERHVTEAPLIKQRDAYAVEDAEGTLLKNAKSVASARTMERIASGKGRRPRPFMLNKPGAANAVWHSRGASK